MDRVENLVEYLLRDEGFESTGPIGPYQKLWVTQQSWRRGDINRQAGEKGKANA